MTRFDLIHVDLLDTLRMRGRFGPVSKTQYIAEQPALAAAERRVGELLAHGFVAQKDHLLLVTDKGMTALDAARRASMNKPRRTFLAEGIKLLNVG